MAIDGYSGLPGSGKSHSLVKHLIVPALIKGREVWTNIPIYDDKMTEKTGSTVTQIDITDITGIRGSGWTKQKPVWEKEPNDNWFLDVLPKGAVLIIDEAWKIWPAGLRLDQIPEAHREFFSMHRHLVNDHGETTSVALVTQDLKKISAAVRGDIDTTYRTRKLDVIGKSDSYMVDVFQGAAEGNRPSKQNLLRQEGPHKYDPEITGLYKSATYSETGEVGEEDRIDDRKNILQSGSFKAIKYAVPAMITLSILALLYAWNEFDDTTEIDAVVQASKPEQIPIQQKTIPESTTSPDPFEGHELFIGYNNGKFPQIDYRIIAEGPNKTYMTLTPVTLRSMGYSVKYIDQCTILASRQDSTHWIMCRTPEVEEQQQSDSTSSFTDII